MIKRIIILVLCNLIFSCKSQVDSVIQEAIKINYNPVYDTNRLKSVVSPFKPFIYKADYHVMAYIDGHNEYESVEAFIFRDNESFEFKAIITDHNKDQVDYISSEKLNFSSSSNTKINRKAVMTTGDFYLAENDKDYIFDFKLEEDKTVRIFYEGLSKPSENYAGITDPTGHSPDAGLPMMYRSLSSMGSKNSYVMIDNTKYEISEDTEISKKPFFTAYKTYLTKDFIFAIIPSHSTTEKVHQYNENQLINENSIRKEVIKLNNNGEIREIKIYSRISSDDKSYMSIEFDPYLPNIVALDGEQTISIRFSILFSASNKKEVYGQVKLKKNINNTIFLELLPEFPVWAKENRNMIYEIDIIKDTVRIKNF